MYPLMVRAAGGGKRELSYVERPGMLLNINRNGHGKTLYRLECPEAWEAVCLSMSIKEA